MGRSCCLAGPGSHSLCQGGRRGRVRDLRHCDRTPEPLVSSDGGTVWGNLEIRSLGWCPRKENLFWLLDFSEPCFRRMWFSLTGLVYLFGCLIRIQRNIVMFVWSWRDHSGSLLQADMGFVMVLISFSIWVNVAPNFWISEFEENSVKGGWLHNVLALWPWILNTLLENK